jgi:aryl-alcohol dehydrogenase-like predicted oxidoreductase
MIATAPFGRTGHESSRTIFGAAALGNVSHADAERTLDLLLAHGVNHIDTAASYGDSELRIASWLRREPGRLFVATKTGDRDYKGAKESIRRSLERLGIDRVDLIQLHNLVDVIEWETALRDGGALEAAVEARDEGLVRFIGVTGHGLSVAAMHRRSLDRFPFDSVLLPYNISQLRHPLYADHFEALARTCAARGVAMQTIKSIALAAWDGRPQTASTWYEPLTDPADIEVAVGWVLARPGIFLNTVGDLNLLPHVLAAAEPYDRGEPSADEVEALVKRRSLTPLFV